MFTVVEIEYVPPLRGLDRFSKRRRRGFALSERTRPRCSHLRLDFPLGAKDAACHKRAEAGFFETARQGSVGVVLPKDFPWPDLPESFGLAVSSPVPLYRRLAPRIASFAADSLSLRPETLSVLLAGRRVSGEMIRAAEALRHRVKSISVEAGRDTSAFCYGLRDRYGIAALEGIHGQVDIAVFFDSPDTSFTFSQSTVALNFSGGAPAISGGIVADGAMLDPPKSYWSDWPGGCDTPALLSAMAASGSARLEDITVKGLTAMGRMLYFPGNTAQ